MTYSNGIIEADLFYFFSRRPEVGENTQSLLDNAELVGEGLIVANSTFEEVAAVMDDDGDEEIDFVIGLKAE